MSLLQDLPQEDYFAGILSRITGSEEDKTGLFGVINLLERIDTASISSLVVSKLTRDLSEAISFDDSILSEGLLDQFNQVLEAFPSEPDQLIGSLNEKLEKIKSISASDLSNQLFEGMRGIEDIQALIPKDTTALLTGAVVAFNQMRQEFISGAWGQLRQWSESVSVLHDEIEPLISSGEGTVEDRFVAYLKKKTEDLLQIIFPQKQGLADILTTQLGSAISTQKLADLESIKNNLIDRMSKAWSEFESGNFTNIAHLRSAEENFKQLTENLSEMVNSINSVLKQEIADAEGLALALEKQFDDFGTVEIVDLGNIKDKFNDAIRKVEEVVQAFDFDGVKEKIEEVFDNVNDVIESINLGSITERLGDLQVQIRSVADGLDAGLLESVASAQNSFEKVMKSLQAVAETVGSYDESGAFHHDIEKDVRLFLEGIKTNLQNNIEPTLDSFKTTTGDALNLVTEALRSVEDNISGVKKDLKGTLTGINRQLDNLNVTGRLNEIRGKLDAMLTDLGEIDFDPVVDPVVAQINEMRDELKEIDLSSFNDYLIGSLKLAVKVVQQLDFPEDITKALLNQIDEILEIPQKVLKAIEDNIENVLKKLSDFEPSVILQPLDNVFAPVSESLDNLELEKLLDPLDEWYERVQQELDQVSPAKLLQPVIDLHDQLKGSFKSISPQELIKPLEIKIADVKSVLSNVNVTGVAVEFSELTDRVKSSMNAYSPEVLFKPFIEAFDKLTKALDSYNPGDLLKPFADIFDKIMAPLDNLTDEHLRLINESFSHLKQLPKVFDPKHNFKAVRQKYEELEQLLLQLNVGQIIVDLKGTYDLLKASLEAGMTENETVIEIVKFLNPISNEKITEVVTAVQEIQTKLQSAFEQPDPSVKLEREYDEIKLKLESFVPEWVKEDMTAASVKRAFQAANPSKFAQEVKVLYDGMRKQVENLDPRVLQKEIKETFELLKQKIFSVDPETISNGTQAVIDNLIQRLDAVDLRILVDELIDLVRQVERILDSFDPRPVIQQLELIRAEIENLINGLKPSEFLRELAEPLGKAKSILEEFDPSAFSESFQSIYKNIKKVIAEIDIGVILRPLNKRLEELRDELEQGLKRTETAFNGMLIAIPV